LQVLFLSKHLLQIILQLQVLFLSKHLKKGQV
jgi:hypothetical protein